MASYAAPPPTDRWKAIAAVIAVHAGLAAIVIYGLKVDMVTRTVEQLKTFDIREPPPPPPVPPPAPAPKPERARKPAGAPAKKAEAAPVVAPPSPRPSPLPAAKVAGRGTAAAPGAGTSGNGTGAGGSGTGPGGGGTDYSRFTPARLIRNLTSGDYRSIGAGRLPSGRAMVSLRVEPTGVPGTCRVIGSSGDAAVDSGLCPLISARLRFRPALNDRGQPIPYELQYVATWQL